MIQSYIYKNTLWKFVCTRNCEGGHLFSVETRFWQILGTRLFIWVSRWEIC